MGKRKKGQPTGKQRRREQRRVKIVRTTQDFWTPFQESPMDNEVRAEGFTKLFWNSRYHVYYRQVESEIFGGTLTHLSIKRNDKECVHDWRDLQRIKNEICGPEHEAIELYPAESRLVDQANQYHLWVMPEGGMVPVGWFEGRIIGTPKEAAETGAKQRPFER
jgi:hypothetical protein